MINHTNYLIRLALAGAASGALAIASRDYPTLKMFQSYSTVVAIFAGMFESEKAQHFVPNAKARDLLDKTIVAHLVGGATLLVASWAARYFGTYLVSTPTVLAITTANCLMDLAIQGILSKRPSGSVQTVTQTEQILA